MGFQAQNVEAIRSDRVVCAVKTADLRVKAFQVVFADDGSLFITFPYFRHRIGILSSSSIPPTGIREAQVNLEYGGKVTSHLVKYSHHVDGRAHFSQTSKIVTMIKRQSIALDRQHGHIFSLLVQGLMALGPADLIKDQGTSPKRSVIDFEVGPCEAIKFVGRWFDINNMRFSHPTPTIGPIVMTQDDDGVQKPACLIASLNSTARHVLAVTCEKIQKLGPAPEIFMFYGGFDERSVMTDPRKEAGFLAFLYPLEEADRLKQKLGTLDYVANRHAGA